MIVDAVSPELVLVDPELAARERARLTEKARLAELLDTPPRSVPTVALTTAAAARAPTFRAPTAAHMLAAALLCSLLANGFLAADLATRDDAGATPVAIRPASVQATSAAHIRRHPRGTRKAAVERKLARMILARPARKLPRAFIDPRTGLLRNNVRVVCRPARKRSFLCAVRLPAGRAHSIVVRYHVGRGNTDVFTWYGARAR